MTLPTFTNWEPTRDSLHRAAQVIGAIRVATIEKMPNALHYSLTPTDTGFSTGVLPVGELQLNFKTATVHVGSHTIALQGHHQVSLTDAVLQTLKDQVKGVELTRKDLQSTTSFDIDLRTSGEYIDVLNWVFTSMARFRARLLGPMTPLVVWPHHFDMGFIWFKTNETDEHKHPHINIGFAPFSDGIDRPYFYAYVWPRPEDLTERGLPKPAYWHAKGWVGARLDYDEILKSRQPGSLIEETLLAIHRVLAVV